MKKLKKSQKGQAALLQQLWEQFQGNSVGNAQDGDEGPPRHDLLRNSYPADMEQLTRQLRAHLPVVKKAEGGGSEASCASKHSGREERAAASECKSLSSEKLEEIVLEIKKANPSWSCFAPKNWEGGVDKLVEKIQFDHGVDEPISLKDLRAILKRLRPAAAAAAAPDFVKDAVITGDSNHFTENAVSSIAPE